MTTFLRRTHSGGTDSVLAVYQGFDTADRRIVLAHRKRRDMNAEVRSDKDLEQRILRTIPARRMAAPDELSTWVVALAGPASDFMTGEVIVIDGGQTVS